MMENEEQVKEQLDETIDQVKDQATQLVTEATQQLSDDEISAKLKETIPTLLPDVDPMQAADALALIVSKGQEFGDQVYDLISESRWEDLAQLVSVNGVSLTYDDINALKDLGELGVQAASAAKILGQDVYASFIRANKSDNFSEEFLKGIFGSVMNAIRNSGDASESLIKILGYLVGGESQIVDLLRERSAEAIVNALTSFLTSKLDPRGGKFGFDPATSYALSLLLSMLPDDFSRNNFLLALSTAIEGYRLGQAATGDALEAVTMAADWAARLMNELSPGSVSTLGGVQIVEEDGVKWYMFPFASGIIAIASKPVAGPDVRVVWNTWSQTTKASLAWVSLVPYVGDTIVQLVNFGATQKTMDAMMDGIRSLDGAEDKVKDYFKFLAQKVIDYSASKVVETLNRNADKIRHTFKTAKDKVVDYIKSLFTNKTTNVQTEPERQLVADTPSSTTQPLPDMNLASEEVLSQVDDLVVDPSQSVQYGVEPWYPGRKPATPGSLYRV